MAPPGIGRRDRGVSVVVATRSRPALLEGLVDAFEGDPALVEMIVVVDGPDPLSVRRLHHLCRSRRWLRWFNPAHLGQLSALDYGIRRASGDVVLLLDDDVLPARGLATGHLERHRRAEGLVVLGSMPVLEPPGVRLPATTRLYAQEYRRHMEEMRLGKFQVLDGLWAGNVSLRRQDCERVQLGSVDFDAFYHSDRELGYRLADAGLVGVFDPALAAVHLHRRKALAFLRDAERQGAGRERLSALHPDRTNPEWPKVPSSVAGRWGAKAVHQVGATRLSRPTAFALMMCGTVLGDLGFARVDMAAAKVARRIMLRRGSVTSARRSATTTPSGCPTMEEVSAGSSS
jgi:GT2 family glycosyltransferase